MEINKNKNLFLRKYVISSVLMLGSSFLYAASSEVIWGDTTLKTLKSFTVIQPQQAASNQNVEATNTLRFKNSILGDQKISHTRYNQYYKGLPVWGYQVIYHAHPNKTTVTGVLITDIEKDVKTIIPNIKLEAAKTIAISAFRKSSGKTTEPKKIANELIIYFDEKNRQAILAYYISFVGIADVGPALPTYIINANTGEIVKSWDALPRAELGQGPGGFSFSNLPYRPGNYQFGNSTPGVNALGKFDIQVKANNVCETSNALFRTINLENLVQFPFEFPVTKADEKQFNLQPFSYSCTAPDYRNLTDEGFSPVNQGLSPVNDVTYFIQESFKMYLNEYGLSQPVGTDLPIRAFTHVGELDNAFAISTALLRELNIDAYQQLTFGNGQTFAPLVSGDVVGHEFAHLVTANFSNLIYAEQSGGINEFFSDAASIAIRNYLRPRFPWYWSGSDWTVGAEAARGLPFLRNMMDPPADGRSIDNAQNFKPGMNVHHSSGVFNKAFYLLSTMPGWTPYNAFRVMLDANMHYWIPQTDFAYGACGAIQAAYARGYNFQQVIQAFHQVGVTCMVDAVTLQ